MYFGDIAVLYYMGGKKRFSFNYTANIANVDIRALAIARGWDQTGDLEVRFTGSPQWISKINLVQNYPGDVYIYFGPGVHCGGVSDGLGNAAVYVAIPLNNPVVTNVHITNDGAWYGAGGRGARGQGGWARGRFVNDPMVWSIDGEGGWGEGFNINTNTNDPTVAYRAPTNGTSGQCQNWSGATTGGAYSFTICGGDGGRGGNWGQKGNYGSLLSITGNPGSQGADTWYDGQPAGYYLVWSPNKAKFNINIVKLGNVGGQQGQT